MKRKVFCVFSLVAYLLLFCTVFAPMAQRETTVLVDVKKIAKNTKTNTRLPAAAGTWGDTQGLFHIVEGTGWNTGSRVEEIPHQYYIEHSDFITLHPGTPYELIISASRAPQVNDLVEVVETVESPGEKLILYLPRDSRMVMPLQNNFIVSQQGEKGMLMDTLSIKMPYFEHRILQSLSDRIQAEGMRVYSYTDARNFLQQLPLLALMGGLLLAGVIIWGGTCVLTKKYPLSKPVWINAGVMGLTLLLMLILSNMIDIPASLMPSDTILNVKHYAGEFSNIFTAMASVGDQSLQNLSFWMIVLSAVCILVLAAMGILLIWLENRRCAAADPS